MNKNKNTAGVFVILWAAFCVCATMLICILGARSAENEKKQNCGKCARFEECKEYVTPDETFPEVGGCECFKERD